MCCAVLCSMPYWYWDTQNAFSFCDIAGSSRKKKQQKKKCFFLSFSLLSVVSLTPARILCMPVRLRICIQNRECADENGFSFRFQLCMSQMSETRVIKFPLFLSFFLLHPFLSHSLSRSLFHCVTLSYVVVSFSFCHALYTSFTESQKFINNTKVPLPRYSYFALVSCSTLICIGKQSSYIDNAHWFSTPKARNDDFYSCPFTGYTFRLLTHMKYAWQIIFNWVVY